MTYGASGSEDLIDHKQVLAFSPAASGGGDENAWEPAQRWDQRSRSFIDIAVVRMEFENDRGS